MLTLLHDKVTFLRLIEVEHPVLFPKCSLQIEINDVLQSLACVLAFWQQHGVAQGDVCHIIFGRNGALLHHRLVVFLHLAKHKDVASVVEPQVKGILGYLQTLRLQVIIDVAYTGWLREIVHHTL